ncbi:hypothetical protein C3L33_17428, partial [Rhododendron williamsianum]
MIRPKNPNILMSDTIWTHHRKRIDDFGNNEPQDAVSNESFQGADEEEEASKAPAKEEEIVLIEAVVSKVVSSCLFSLVGRLLISRKFNKMAFKDCLRKAWGMKANLRIVEEVGRVIGSKIGELLEVDDRLEGGEQGRFIRVRARLKVNTPLKRGGNIVCGGSRKVWVDYKYERIPSFCFYCGRVDHAENVYLESWLRRHFSSDHGGGARSSDGYGKSGERGILTKNKGGDWGDNQLVELGDNSVISLNGKSHRVGDLFPSESDVNKGNSYDLSKHGKKNQGMQLSIDNGPGRELAGLHVLHPISTGPAWKDLFEQ